MTRIVKAKDGLHIFLNRAKVPARARVKDAKQRKSNDMSPEEMQQLRSLVSKFLGEEANEKEHQADCGCKMAKDGKDIKSLSRSDVDQALRNAGYSDNGLVSVSFAKMISGKAMYKTVFRGEDGNENGAVYIEERNGRFYGEY